MQVRAEENDRQTAARLRGQGHATRGLSLLAVKLAKYTAVGRITVRNHLAYVYDFLIRSLFLLVILYVFLQLWTVTFEGVGSSTIAGYRFDQIIWYLIFAEAIIMASPRLSLKVEEEVKKGDVGYQLTRPMSYLLYHYAAYMGEAAVRLTINLAVGGTLGLVVFGVPKFGMGWLGYLLLAAGAFTVNFLISMMLALCAFWVEETRGLEFVYNKLLFTIGGMMLPLETFPDLLQKVCTWLPFQTVVYFPSKMAVQFDAALLVKFLVIQILWIALLSVLLALVYRKGVKKLNVNGG
jgi:ABC-2 type transport system permease protein